jgi:FKBP-type peptidyl-prolyl cis-trans isomerase FkpA
MNRYPLAKLLVFLLLITGLSSCNTPDPFDPVSQLNSDVSAIDARLAATPNVIKHVTGVSVVINELGEGLPASLYLDPVVKVKYVGKLFSDGSTFDSGTTDKAKVSGFISGWQVALSILPVGSKATVYVPSYYGYGNSNTGTIPANSILVFDIEFQAITPSSAQITQFTSDSTKIEKYLADNNINAAYDSAGMWYTITDTTDAAKPTIYDQVKVKYTYKTFDGDTISTLEEKPVADQFDSRVADYLNGIQAGLLNMNEGSKAIFYIPSTLGFASRSVTYNSGKDKVEPNTNLVVEMELIDILP